MFILLVSYIIFIDDKKSIHYTNIPRLRKKSYQNNEAVIS